MAVIYPTSEKTRDLLIDAAGRLAAEKGFDSVTTRQIAELSGENIGSIHYHFGSKHKLFLAAIMRVVERWLENPLSQILAGFDLDTREGQIGAVESLIRREVELLFNPNAPDWHCQLIRQVLQTPSELLETFQEAFIGPESDVTFSLFHKIDPQIDQVMAIKYKILIIAPLMFHIDYRMTILERLGKTAYDEDYINNLTEISISQALKLLNLY
jgi:AcrR family transcriptional regulator